MSFFPALATWQFALAGALCAAVPVILHILNRRRFRVVEWAAMQFLREAMQRRRRMMQIRDLVLMILRTAAVFLFGLALARPFLTARQEQHDAGQPIHAVLLIDNSLSMNYQTLEGTLLERAKQRASAFIEKLPVGSRITVVPLAGSESGFSAEPFDTKPFALEALERIAVVDRSVNFRQAVNEARRAADMAADLAQRFILFSDQRRTNWTDLAALDQNSELPAMQLVDVAEPDWDNTWIADLRIPDGVADTQTPTTIQVQVRHHGRDPRRDIRLALWIREQEVDSQIVSFESADATLEATFEYTFRDTQPQASQPEFVPIKVTLSPDRLVEDDERHLVVPVVAVLPVVFVDQYGSEEDPVRNRFGETRHLRHLMAPVANDETKQLIQVRHVQIGQLDRDLLADARLVVIAGVSEPGEQVPLLREYVEQGGQLVIAAGNDFDPGSWNTAAWGDGQGILPLPLQPDLLGSIPSSASSEVQPMFLSFESLSGHPYFQLPGNAEDSLRDLYAEPFFFQVVQVDASRAGMTAAATTSSVSDSSVPSWLLWSPPEEESGGRAVDEKRSSNTTEGGTNSSSPSVQPSSAQVTVDRQPRVLARLTSESGPPFLVERSIGRGKILFVASGLFSGWNTLPKTNAIVMFDRILRSMLQSTLPGRNYGPVDRIAVPLPAEAREDRIVLQRPRGDAIGQSLEPGFLRTDLVGVTIDRPLSRGIYRVAALSNQANTNPAEAPKQWHIDLAVNGYPEESDLQPFERESFERHPIAQQLRWVGLNEEISLAGARIRGQDLWWWLALVVLLLLLAEFVVIGWPALVGRTQPTAANPLGNRIAKASE